MNSTLDIEQSNNSNYCPVTQKPNVIFYNLTNAGASAIVPILNELLPKQFGYKIFKDPSHSEKFEQNFSEDQPPFHWTHSPKSLFRRYLSRDDFRFICLYRDPRDVLLSHVKDRFYVGDRSLEYQTEKEVFFEYISTNFGNMFNVADEWIHSNQRNILVMSFEDLTKNVPLATQKILTFLGLPLCQSVLSEVCNRHSFESVTQRKRGEDGPIVRKGFLWRKGVSGEWRNKFDPDVQAAFNIQFGRILNRWGYNQP